MFMHEEQLACERLVTLALAEDLGHRGDVTSQAVIPESLRGRAVFLAKANGVLAGLPAAELVMKTVDAKIRLEALKLDGERIGLGDHLAAVAGPMRSILAGERTALNFVQHLSGIATLTRRFVDAVAGLPVKILDTRKTLPGWRLLEKYAVRIGGGHNHRMGLHDGMLIKDNHLAAMPAPKEANKARMEELIQAAKLAVPPRHLQSSAEVEHALEAALKVEEAVRLARTRFPDLPIEIEVDSVHHAGVALLCRPAIVLLDNMSREQMREAVVLRDQWAPQVLLEASGGITLDNVRAVAETGVNRISIGALTHSAPALDVSLEYQP
jgi:nicotinate-nucleotide pyrophosphorylase (carboxylating)